MRMYGDTILARATRIVADRQIARDVVQETFLEVHRALPTFRGQSSFKTWLVAIATHRGLDVVRRQRSEGRWTAADVARSAADRSAPDLPSIVDGPRRVRELERCLRVLCPEVRAAVEMRFHLEMSYEEMASVCGDKPATLQARVTRAMPVLRRCLERKGIVP